ncbi:ester cyclase [Mastigocoleus testarum]|uniref:SnoaL-like polyketide cyclase n=1 Tax=Mastigocoleus testarum BC008 TaxID=371196 RepID=A0A0V7ZE25_9CYAN|nr:ester cyclase [Mastigocoleus testarum]KST62744.1 SnoaL-like polyketide cyclase [Mastigocoleus testarum BC008]
MTIREPNDLHLWVQDRDTVLEYSDNVEWRYDEKPDYSRSNARLAEESTRNHPQYSLEDLVQNLVRTFDIEANFKTNPQQWISVVNDEFRMSTNGGKDHTVPDLIESGTYKALIGDTTHYKASEEDFESSTNLFHTAFPDGFLWEVLEVYSEPPNITFKWRHWGHFTGSYKDYLPTGETIEIIGMSVVRVTDDLKIISLEHFYDNTKFLDSLTSVGKPLEVTEEKQKPNKFFGFLKKLNFFGFPKRIWNWIKKKRSRKLETSRCPFKSLVS